MAYEKTLFRNEQFCTARLEYRVLLPFPDMFTPGVVRYRVTPALGGRVASCSVQRQSLIVIVPPGPVRTTWSREVHTHLSRTLREIPNPRPLDSNCPQTYPSGRDGRPRDAIYISSKVLESFVMHWNASSAISCTWRHISIELVHCTSMKSL